jgi:uncharacterized tellurite resistance protein B-like protein
MLDALQQFFHGRAAAEAANGAHHPAVPVQVAACALLLELAHADGDFSDSERQYIHNALGRHFGLDEAGLEELLRVAEAERREAIDHFAFTREIAREYDLGQKMVLVEVMWGVVLADGELATDEAYLIRKIANLLDIEPAYLSEARNRAANRG